MTLEIRTVDQGDAGELFRLRRSALLDSPLAFLASPEDDLASSEAAVRELRVAAQLLDAAIRWARTLDGVRSVHLSVSESAVAARRLYERAGFETWGIEAHAIRFAERSESEHHMRLSLGGGV